MQQDMSEFLADQKRCWAKFASRGCPACGSKDVIVSPLPKTRELLFECLSCGRRSVVPLRDAVRVPSSSEARGQPNIVGDVFDETRS